jgi:hypothetical protein
MLSLLANSKQLPYLRRLDRNCTAHVSLPLCLPSRNFKCLPWNTSLLTITWYMNDCTKARWYLVKSRDCKVRFNQMFCKGFRPASLEVEREARQKLVCLAGKEEGVLLNSIWGTSISPNPLALRTLYKAPNIEYIYNTSSKTQRYILSLRISLQRNLLITCPGSRSRSLLIGSQEYCSAGAGYTEQ